MKLPSILTTVTPLSKFLALFLFFLLPLAGFKLGMDYANIVYRTNQSVSVTIPQITPPPKQNEMSDWKTYRNEKYQFSIKYPPTFEVFNDGIDDFIMKPGGELDGTDAFSFYKVGFHNLDSTKDIKQIISEEQAKIKDSFGPKTFFTNVVEIPLGKYNALSYYNDCAGYCQNIYLKKNKSLVLSIEVIYANKEMQIKSQEEINQILSTFRLLDDTTSITPVSSKQQFCDDLGGKWINGYNECENINNSQCQEAGGTFEECASNCRHDPAYPNVYCIQMCVPVCKF